MIHASGIFIVILSYFIPVDLLIILCITILIFLEIIFRWDRYRYIPLFSPILRRCKRSHDERGSIYFFIGILITLIIFHNNLAVANAAILILLFGDSASTVVGRKYGKIRLPFQNHKTLEGSLAFFIIGLVFALTQLPPIPSLFGVLAGTITEAYSPIDDNLTVPVISGLVMGLVVYLPI